MNVHCLFAKGARVWGSMDWNAALSYDENIQRSVPAFTLFAATQKGIDGFLFSIPGVHVGDTIEHFAASFNRLLRRLSDIDPEGYHCMRRSYVADRGWTFSFASAEFFVTSFSPCYGIDNARYTYGVTYRIFVFFQPYHSFIHHDVGPDKAFGDTEWEHPVLIRDKIRCRFYAHNQKYFIPDDPLHYPVGRQFVPALDNSPTVEWWKMPLPE